jgi:hypothetical protein
MNTKQKYESSRNIKPTRFSPKELANYKITGYQATSGTSQKPNFGSEIFDEIIEFRRDLGIVKAFGMVIGKQPTVLILKAK